MKIKVIEERELAHFEGIVNDFIKKQIVINIKYQKTRFLWKVCYSALIMYA